MTGPISQAIGGMVTGADVEAAAVATIRRWQETYVAEIERQQERDAHSLPLIKSFMTQTMMTDKRPEQQMPAALVISPGLSGAPHQEGAEGRTRASWILGVGIVVTADTQINSNALAKLYGAAVRTLILQNGSLGGFAAGTSWTDERYNEFPVQSDRNLSGVQVIFHVDVEGVVYSKLGLSEPPVDPYAGPSNWNTAQTENVTVTKEQ